jgi:hypothetical protein
MRKSKITIADNFKFDLLQCVNENGTKAKLLKTYINNASRLFVSVVSSAMKD